MTNNILIIAAHSDDQTIGPGGTAAKYAKEGFDVRTVIFSKGEISYPHFQEKIIVGTREKEALRADKIIGGKGVKFLGVLEKDFNKEVEIYKAKTQLERVIKKLRPTKIFTHSPDDPHPAHRKISTLTLEIVDSLPWQLEVYGFDIWSPFKFKKKTFPTLVVDITDTFDIKIHALKAFKSQFSLHNFLNFFPLGITLFKNWSSGWKYKYKYAEVFYRLR